MEAAVGRQVEERADGRRARGDRTRKAILDHAIQIASSEGLEGLSIGRLAEELGVSKSGLFAHFGSKVELQVATVQAAREVFLDEVVASARVGGGVQEVYSLTDAWLGYMEREVFRGGCFFSAASLEFDGRPGPVRDEVASMVSEWLMALEAAMQDAQEAGHVTADLDPRQLAFELHSLGMGANWAFQLYQDREAFDRARSAIRQRLDALLARWRHSRSMSTRVPLAGPFARRSPGSSASLPPCSPPLGRAMASTGTWGPRALRGCSTWVASRRCATISRRAWRRSVTRSGSAPRGSRTTAR